MVLTRLANGLNRYYALIHPTLPLLPHSKSRLQQLLDSAPVLIRDAFLEAVYAAIHSSPSFSQRPSLPPSRPRRAAELCLAAQYDSSVSSRSAKLILLQTMILLALEADSHGPRASGPSRATWVGSAVGLSHSMKLHYFDSGAEESAGGDSDTDEKLGRRAYWVLVVLDRWQAISTNSPLLIPDGTVVLMPEDQQLLGVAPFHLVRKLLFFGPCSLVWCFTSGIF